MSNNNLKKSKWDEDNSERVSEEKAKRKEQNFITTFLDKKGAIKEASHYDQLVFHKKTKNILGIYYTFTLLMGFAFFARWNNRAEEALVPLAVIPRGAGRFVPDYAYIPFIGAEYLITLFVSVIPLSIFIIFIFLNHRWSLILTCTIYVIIQIYLASDIVQGTGNGFLGFVLMVICYFLIKHTYRACITATALSKYN